MNTENPTLKEPFPSRIIKHTEQNIFIVNFYETNIYENKFFYVNHPSTYEKSIKSINISMCLNNFRINLQSLKINICFFVFYSSPAAIEIFTPTYVIRTNELIACIFNPSISNAKIMLLLLKPTLKPF